MDWPLVPHDISENEGLEARQWADLLYTDRDSDDSLGLAVLWAASPDWGAWQYRLEGADWVELPASPALPPLPPGIQLEQTFRGVVPVSEVSYPLFRPVLTVLCVSTGPSCPAATPRPTSPGPRQSAGPTWRRLAPRSPGEPPSSPGGSVSGLSLVTTGGLENA